MQQPLLEDWRLYCKYLTSPDSYINMSFYFMIGAALQRRVWIGSCEMPIFPNMYVVLVGKPGLGKTIVIKPIASLMKFHKLHKINYEEQLKPSLDNVAPDKAKEIQDYIELIEQLKKAKESKNYMDQDPLLFPVPADATTYESLVQSNANVSRLFKCNTEHRELYKSIIPPSGIYKHSSMCSMLEEMSSLFNEDADKLVKFFLVCWDCQEDYTYATKHQGVDKIRNGCFSLLAGTTPDFMRESFNSKLIGEGFAARTLFIFEEENRFHLFGVPNYDDEQLAAKARILKRLRELSLLFGQCKFSQDAHAFLKNYFEKVLPNSRHNTSTKLEHYYSRKVQHVPKLAMAMHFADSDSMEIQLDIVLQAMAVLEKLESKMHLALQLGSKNYRVNATNKINKVIQASHISLTFYEIWRETEGELNEQQLKEQLDYLIQTNQIERIQEDGRTKYKKKI